jgi:hypothetical protein
VIYFTFFEIGYTVCPISSSFFGIYLTVPLICFWVLGMCRMVLVIALTASEIRFTVFCPISFTFSEICSMFLVIGIAFSVIRCTVFPSSFLFVEIGFTFFPISFFVSWRLKECALMSPGQYESNITSSPRGHRPEQVEEHDRHAPGRDWPLFEFFEWQRGS